MVFLWHFFRMFMELEEIILRGEEGVGKKMERKQHMWAGFEIKSHNISLECLWIGRNNIEGWGECGEKNDGKKAKYM